MPELYVCMYVCVSLFLFEVIGLQFAAHRRMLAALWLQEMVGIEIIS
jgi:hypothetical protein